ncbi:protein phosphatase 2C domain-containing protein [Oscillatoria sp. CS-180]|nr:protein phosphatase 2C domain-containing protein [Oscillatoria sp. CS-180]
MSAERVGSQTRVCLWVMGAGADTVPEGETVGDRYEVIAPQIWRDLTPDSPPQTPDSIPDTVLPYLKAHHQRLHVPGIYDVVVHRGKAPLILLENAPVNARSGELYPTLLEQWGRVSSVRQISWLWQSWQLWQSLQPLGTAASLLDFDIVRVEGWRVRLLQLISDPKSPSLKDLGRHWQRLIEDARPTIATALSQVCDALISGSMSPEQLTIDLNYLLLKESAQQRPRLRMAGETHPGPNQSRNEDACYPEGEQPEIPTPRIAIVCDGVGGHEAGEVASQIALRALQPQLQGLIAESGREENAVPPHVVAQQIEAAVRVVNDLVNTQNDLQNRSDRQRMGTTIVMALVVPQRLKTPQGWIQVDELYLAHVGDSRAYWITPDYCHQLTVDDDIAGREVLGGRAFYTALRDRPEAGALTQAIGTRGSTYLTPHVQRFLWDEEGVLLLCSDGLSDNQQIESAWANYIGLITKHIISLPSAVASLIELANQKNGHDNVSVVLVHSKPALDGAYTTTPDPEAASSETPEDDLTDASKALLYGEEEEVATVGTNTSEGAPRAAVPRWWVITVAIAILFFAGVAGWWVAGQIAPTEESNETELSE